MATTTGTDRTVRPLSMPELLTIASVVVGRMDQDASHMPYVGVDVDLNVLGTPQIRLMLDQRPGEASHAQGVAFLADLARAVGEPVDHRKDFHIDSVDCLDWEGTGISVCGRAVVRPKNDT
ncbi:hypothetical protein AB0I72_11415 [Nocardiopsis sp. NPDC049922]|uniref:hypothetical protein n=1 Tax=Nocardiopsis sp. NPDC049922 TaxID=3155157 RepID=UPI0033F8EAD6